MGDFPQPEMTHEMYLDESWERWGYGLLLLGALLRICFFFFATNNGGDALARAATTAKWLAHPTPALEFAGPHWLPIHFWMMAALSLLVHSVSLGSRLLSLAFAIFSLWALWRLAKQEYGVRAALLSLIVFTFYSLHIGYSTTSSSEATYMGLALAGLVCFCEYRRTRNLWLLALSGLALTLAAGIRYEAWLFIAIMGALLAFNSPKQDRFSARHFLSALIFGLIAGSWPVLWMFNQWKVHGDPLYGIHHNADAIASQIAINPAHAGLYQLLLPPGVILLTVTPIAIVGAIYTLYLAAREPRGRELAIIAVGFMLIQFRSLVTGGILAGARYTVTDGTLLALLTGYGLYRLALRFPAVSYRMVVTATATVMIVNLVAITALSAKQNRFADKFRSISPLLQYPGHVQEVRQYLAHRLGPHDAVVIDNYNEESNIVAAAIGMPLLPGNRVFKASEAVPSDVNQYIDANRPDYVILADSGSLAPYIPLSSNCPNRVQIKGVEYSCVYHNEMYRLYSVSYPESPRQTAQAIH
jgi:4-amino-4-deoxy-L-arabinose transferase-like glycosyltransferase